MAGFVPLRITRIIQETPESSTFVLDPVNGSQILYKAGQFLTLIFQIPGGEIRRSYSISASPACSEPLSVTIKRKTNGQVSRFILDRCRAGDLWYTLEPSGMFTVDPVLGSRDIFLFGAGIGISPLYSHLKTFLRLEPACKITLVYSNTNRGSIIFLQQIRDLELEFPQQFTCIHILSQGGSGDPVIHGHLNNGLVEFLVARRLRSDPKEAVFLICGPPHYMRMVMLTLRYMGYGEQQIRRENFVVPLPPDPDRALLQARMVRILSSGGEKMIRVKAGESILSAAIDQGIPLPYSCRGGVCSTCRCRLLAGQVTMSVNEVLTDQDLLDGWILTCTGYPLDDNVTLRVES